MSDKNKVDALDVVQQSEALVSVSIDKLMYSRGYTRSDTHSYRERDGIRILYLKNLVRGFDVLKKYLMVKITAKSLSGTRSSISINVQGGLYHIFDAISRPVVNETVRGYANIQTEEGVYELVSDIDGIVKMFDEKMKNPSLVARLITVLKPYPRLEVAYARVYKV